MIPGIFLIFQFIFFFSPPDSPPEVLEIPDGSYAPSAKTICEQLSCPEMNLQAFQMAYQGYQNLAHQDLIERDSILTLIDFSKASTEKRFFIIDLKHEKVLEKSLVAHGKNTGVLFAENFSNTPHSNQSSLGFFLTGNTYQGKHGYSLRIKGMEPGINSNAWQRAIVIHGANYVSENFISKHGRLGRSFGCPALPYDISRKVIDLIKDSSCLFIYSPDESYLDSSSIISPSYYSQIIPE